MGLTIEVTVNVFVQDVLPLLLALPPLLVTVTVITEEPEPLGVKLNVPVVDPWVYVTVGFATTDFVPLTAIMVNVPPVFNESVIPVRVTVEGTFINALTLLIVSRVGGKLYVLYTVAVKDMVVELIPPETLLPLSVTVTVTVTAPD